MVNVLPLIDIHFVIAETVAAQSVDKQHTLAG
jgi:hypothetical protein